MSYKKVLEALRAYAPKELIHRCYQLGYGCCAVGAVLPTTRTWGTTRIRYLYEDNGAVREEARTLGVTHEELNELQRVNDDLNECYEAERYAKVLAWLEMKVAEEEGQ